MVLTNPTHFCNTLDKLSHWYTCTLAATYSTHVCHSLVPLANKLAQQVFYTRVPLAQQVCALLLSMCGCLSTHLWACVWMPLYPPLGMCVDAFLPTFGHVCGCLSTHLWACVWMPLFPPLGMCVDASLPTFGHVCGCLSTHLWACVWMPLYPPLGMCVDASLPTLGHVCGCLYTHLSDVTATHME